jgi:hypothetical protein
VRGFIRLPQPLDGEGENTFLGRGNGLVLYAKRLEKGSFRWPVAGESSIALSGSQLMELLAGREAGLACSEEA